MKKTTGPGRPENSHDENLSPTVQQTFPLTYGNRSWHHDECHRDFLVFHQIKKKINPDSSISICTTKQWELKIYPDGLAGITAVGQPSPSRSAHTRHKVHTLLSRFDADEHLDGEYIVIPHKYFFKHYSAVPGYESTFEPRYQLQIFDSRLIPSCQYRQDLAFGNTTLGDTVLGTVVLKKCKGFYLFIGCEDASLHEQLVRSQFKLCIDQANEILATDRFSNKI